MFINDWLKIHEYSFHLFSMQSEKTGKPFRNTCLCLHFRDSEHLVIGIVLSNCCIAQHQTKCISFFLLLINITTALGTVKEHSKTPATVDPWMKSSAEINTAVWWSRDKTLGTLPLTGHSLKLLPMNQTCICLFNSSVGKWNKKKTGQYGSQFCSPQGRLLALSIHSSPAPGKKPISVSPWALTNTTWSDWPTHSFQLRKTRGKTHFEKKLGFFLALPSPLRSFPQYLSHVPWHVSRLSLVIELQLWRDVQVSF